MKRQPLVSVVIPIYNVEDYLEQCISSVFSQTYKNLEIILVDDGSTDNSSEIAERCAKKDKRAKIIHQKNGGLSAARNTGISVARGEFICFVDSDDYISEDFVAKLLELAIKNEADIATCSFEPFSKDGSIVKRTPTWPIGSLSGYDATIDMLKNKRPAYIWLGMYKKSLFTDNLISFPDGRIFEDIATKIKLMLNSKKVCYLNEQLYSYRIRKDSITGKTFSKKQYDDYLYAVYDAASYLENNNIEKTYSDYFIFYSLLTLANYIAREKNQSRAYNMYWRKIRAEAKSIFKGLGFLTLKEKIYYRFILFLMRFRKIYSFIYRTLKK